MPRNASGSYTLPSGNPVVSGTLIDATWANNTLSDLGNEVTDSLSRSGEGAMLAPLRITDGVQATPSLAFSNEPSSGLYRAGSNEWWAVAAGVQNLRFTNTGLTTRAAAGAVGTPSIAAFNDTDTGIYFPGANELAIATGGAARMTFDSAGAVAVPGTFSVTGNFAVDTNVLFVDAASNNVGIGTASPSDKLTVAGHTRLGTGTTTPILLTLYPSASAKGWQISANNYVSSALEFTCATAAGGTTFTTPSMLLDSSGNLGLGVTPSAWAGKALQIGNASNSGWASIGYDANGKGFFSTSAYNNTGSSWTYTATGFAATLYSADAGSHKWYTAPSGTAGNAISFTQALTLDASGNLGLGTTSPGDPNSFGRALDIRSSTGAAAYFRDSDDATKYSVAGFFGADSNAYYGSWGTGTGVLFYSAGTERGRFTSGGEFLVGTTTANAGSRLRVIGSGTSSSTYCTIFENSGSAILFAVQDDGRWRSGTAAASPYNYIVGGTNRDLFVDNGGEIGYVSSVRASKTNITPDVDTDWLLQLNPVTFNFRKRDEDGNYTNEADGPIKHGLIAEEVEEVNADLCFYDDEEKGGALRGVNYSHLITPMLKLIQKQQAAIAVLEDDVAALKGAK